MRTVLRCRVGDAHAVDDLMQEIALAVCKQAVRPTSVQQVAPWLYRLAVRQAVTFHRRSGRQRALLSGLASHQEVHGRPEPDDPLTWLVSEEQRTAVAHATAQLSSRDREILMLKYAHGWTYNQLAEHLGVNFNTVEYRLLRAKKRLRQLLCGLCAPERNHEPTAGAASPLQALQTRCGSYERRDE